MPTSQALFMAPRHVYAGTISNKTDKSVICTIYYSSNSKNKHDESISVTLDSGGRAFIPEREYQPTPEATFTCRKIVSRIDVQVNEQTLTLEQPFDGVTCPMTEWRFDIHGDRIASINPNAQTSAAI
ncbi:unnamed protein product [Rotaria magnacalcarata]|uniref:Uncharacterized protein n=1 Tax=Rotaria magnacalcarata TaxID=392030 RepID=A0A816SCA6_9BILA|nr:unnamed protein product [Rotaria magnacalcarata]CAF1483984.1 unnamed protein product [Rotaria magnacalcarata]CAF2079734.1 unnamed protein product [Rotaria magnacalcarata]CAF2156297.1 unnamed protein product [Rotaria magnacalcarata]CAF2244210.1 unnamed protein product [Rotaria magnacalcarata]